MMNADRTTTTESPKGLSPMAGRIAVGITPGPWVSRRGTIGTAQFHIAEMMPSAYADMPPGFAPAEQQEANARAIAAVPDLIALAQLIERLSSSPMQRDYVAPEVQAAAKAVLARVRGAA